MVWELGKTIGLEIEVDGVDPGTINLNGNFWGRHDDASIVSGEDIISGLITSYDINGRGSRLSSGTEIVSRKSIDVTREEDKNEIYKLLRELNRKGLNQFSERAGIHVHVTLGNNLNILKNSIRWALHLEDVIFLLGTMGNSFRGLTNNSIYCRPISGKGPQIVRTRKGSGPVFVVEDLLNSKDVEEFLTRYGDSYRDSDRYIPVRYTCVNLIPLGRQGSIEFRTFNLTNNVEFLFAIIYFCLEVVRRILISSFSQQKQEKLEINSVFAHRDIDDIVKTLDDFLQESEIPLFYREMLLKMCRNADVNSIRFKEEYTYSHLIFHSNGDRTRQYFSDCSYCTPVITEEIVKPEWMDRHRFKMKKLGSLEIVEEK